MTFRLYCSACKQEVNAVPVSTDKDFWASIMRDEDVAVIHTIASRDHRWVLTKAETQSLLKVRPRD